MIFSFFVAIVDGPFFFDSFAFSTWKTHADVTYGRDSVGIESTQEEYHLLGLENATIRKHSVPCTAYWESTSEHLNC